MSEAPKKRLPSTDDPISMIESARTTTTPPPPIPQWTVKYTVKDMPMEDVMEGYNQQEVMGLLRGIPDVKILSILPYPASPGPGPMASLPTFPGFPGQVAAPVAEQKQPPKQTPREFMIGDQRLRINADGKLQRKDYVRLSEKELENYATIVKGKITPFSGELFCLKWIDVEEIENESHTA